MTTTPDNVVCSDCGAEISVVNDTITYRTPCATCGGISRAFQKSLSGSLVLRSSLRLTGFVTSKTKWFVKLMSEPSFTHHLRVWCHRLKVENKRTNEYLEILTNPETGEILHKCEEPLTEHHGHGTAKKSR